MYCPACFMHLSCIILHVHTFSCIVHAFLMLAHAFCFVCSIHVSCICHAFSLVFPCILYVLVCICLAFSYNCSCMFHALSWCFMLLFWFVYTFIMHVSCLFPVFFLYSYACPWLFICSCISHVFLLHVPWCSCIWMPLWCISRVFACICYVFLFVVLLVHALGMKNMTRIEKGRKRQENISTRHDKCITKEWQRHATALERHKKSMRECRKQFGKT